MAANRRGSSVNNKITMLLEESMKSQFDDMASVTTGPHAARRIARQQLYGVGGGGIVPRVKSSKSRASRAEARSSSPEYGGSPPGSPSDYMSNRYKPNYLSSGNSLATNSMSSLGMFNDDSSSVFTLNRNPKPSKSRYAHDAMYSLITFPNAPDRVFQNTIPSDTPPNFPKWYMGHNNSSSNPPTVTGAVNRYGNRGAYRMKLRNANPNAKGPEALAAEYTPKLSAMPHKPALCQFSSPGLWPESATYPCGVKLKRAVTASSYKRESTVVGTFKEGDDEHRNRRTRSRNRSETPLAKRERQTARNVLHVRSGGTPEIDGRSIRTAMLDDDESLGLEQSIRMDREHERMDCMASMAESHASRMSYLSRPRTQQMMRVKSEGVIPSRSMKYSGQNLIIKADTSGQRHAAEDANTGKRPGTQNGSMYGTQEGFSAGDSLEEYAFRDSMGSIGMSNGGATVAGAKPARGTLAAKWYQVGRFIKILFSTQKNPVTFEPEPAFLTRVTNLDIILMEFLYVTHRNKHTTIIYRDQFIQALTTKVDNLVDSQANVLFSSFDIATKNQINYSTFIATCMLISKPEQDSDACLAELWMLYKHHKGDYLAMDNITEIFTLPCASHEDVGVMEKELKEVFRPACYKLAAGVEKKLDKGAVPEGKEKGGKKAAKTKSLRPTTTTFNLCNGVVDLDLFKAACVEARSTVRLFDQMRREQLLSGGARTAVKMGETKSVAERVKAIKSRRVSLVI